MKKVNYFSWLLDRSGIGRGKLCSAIWRVENGQILRVLLREQHQDSNLDCSKIYSASGGRIFKTFQENLIHPRPYSQYPIYVLFTALYPLFDSFFVIAVLVVQGSWIEVLYNSFNSYRFLYLPGLLLLGVNFCTLLDQSAGIFIGK